MEYSHTQRGFWHYVLGAVALLVVVVAWAMRGQPTVMSVLLAVAALIAMATPWLGKLTVEDAGDRLEIYFGPFPLFRKGFFYESISGVEADRSTLLDGWGIHYIPGRGWIYNLWGYDCVKLTLGKKTVRIGSDDVANLIRFLERKIESSASSDHR